MKKRKVTKAKRSPDKKAVAKRAPAKRAIAKRKKSVKKVVVYTPIKKERATMARKRKRATSATKKAPARRRKSSVSRGVNLSTITRELMPLGLALAAVFGGSMIMKKVPGLSPKIKPFIPLAAGIFLRVTGKKQIIREIGTGLTMLGGIAAVNQFVPAIAMQGDEELMGAVMPGLLGVNDLNLLGEPVNVMGDDDTYSGDNDLMGAVMLGDDLYEGDNQL